MINIIEILFGFAAVVILGGIVMRFMKRPEPAARLLYLGTGALILALILELYVRLKR